MRYRCQSRSLFGSRSDGPGYTNLTIAVECTVHHVQDSIDDAPRGVSRDGFEQCGAGFVLAAASRHAGRQREGQYNDQTSDDLGQTFVWFEACPPRNTIGFLKIEFGAGPNSKQTKTLRQR